MLQSCKAAKLQSCKAAKLQSCKAAKLQSCKAAKLQSCKAAKLKKSTRFTLSSLVIALFLTSNYAVANTKYGTGAVASGTDSTATGQGSVADGVNSVALGAKSNASHDNEVNIGIWDYSTSTPVQTGTRTVSGLSDGVSDDEG